MNRVIHFEIQADNVERAKTFYSKVFGWKITHDMKAEDGGGMDYWGLTTGDSQPGINGGLFQRPKEKDDQSYMFDCTIEVKDLDKAMASVKANGGKVVRDKMEIPEVGWFASVQDTEGNYFGLMQPTGWQPK